MENKGIEFWSSEEGRSYTLRNPKTADDMERLCVDRFGISRTDMNLQFIGDIPRHARILEVGTNVGVQLSILQKMGFVNLCGIELQRDAVEQSKVLRHGVDIIQGDAVDIPFKDELFDVVFTSGLLIHIIPSHVSCVLDEMYRVSKRYIWMYEYYAPTLVEIPYRGQTGILWKDDFHHVFCSRYPDLKTVKLKQFKYKDSENVDEMVLLEKCEQ